MPGRQQASQLLKKRAGTTLNDLVDLNYTIFKMKASHACWCPVQFNKQTANTE